MTQASGDVTRLSFEDALRELESIVQQLEAGDVRLEDSLQLYQRGEALKKHCAAKLAAAKMKIDELTVEAPKASKQNKTSSAASDDG